MPGKARDFAYCESSSAGMHCPSVFNVLWERESIIYTSSASILRLRSECGTVSNVTANVRKQESAACACVAALPSSVYARCLCTYMRVCFLLHVCLL